MVVELHRVICAWCKTVLVEGTVNAPVSHGICRPCMDEQCPQTDPKNQGVQYPQNTVKTQP